jgi:dethiobiotin synthetase
MKRRNLRVKGIIFNGEDVPETKRIILHHAGCPCLLHIYPESIINPEVVKKYAQKFLGQ